MAASGFAERAAHALKLFAERGYPIPSQPWLAAKASSYLVDEVITQPVVGRWLAGQSTPDTSARACAFARALMVDPGWLVFGEESGAPPPQGAPQLRAVEHAPTGIARRGGKEVPERVSPRRKRAGS